MKKLFILFILGAIAAFPQANGVGQIWSYPTVTLQSAAVANGNGTVLSVGGLSAVGLTVNCSVACSGGTAINFEGSEDNTNYVSLLCAQYGVQNTFQTTVTNQNTTPTVWFCPVPGLQSVRARISAYSAGTVTVTGHAVAMPLAPFSAQTNMALLGGANVAVGNGTSSAGTLRVAIASDQTQLTNKLLVTPDANVKVNAVGNAGASFDAATGAAPAANAIQAGGLGSGATGGLIILPTICDQWVAINGTASAQLIAGVAGRKIYFCSGNIQMNGGANTVSFVSGTGATCGTGTTAVPGFDGATAAANGYSFAANSGMAFGGSGMSAFAQTANNADNFCILVGSATRVVGGLSYAIR